MAWAVLCLLVAQRATPAALARALPDWKPSRAGRARLTRVQQWTGPTVRPRGRESPAHPRCPDAAAVWRTVVVALDTTRLGPWEVWLADIVVAGRTMPIG